MLISKYTSGETQAGCRTADRNAGKAIAHERMEEQFTMKCKGFGKRGLSLLLAGAMTLGLLSVCSSETGSGKLVKVAICVSATTPAATAMREVFKPMVEEQTDGRYSVQLYEAGVLGSEKATYDYTRSGIVEMCVVGTAMWSETPVMTIPDFPFVFRDVEHARHCYQGELGDYITGEIESEQPVQLLSWFPNGARAFSSNKPLAGLDDFRGQKLRMPNNPIHVRLAESLGANVVIMDMGEVFTSLEQGVVDGQDNPLSTVKSEGWFEVQDYIYNTNHIVASLELFAGQEFWDDMDEADRAVFEQAALEASDYAWDLYISQLDADKQFMIDEGLTVTELTQEDQAAMVKAIQPVYDYLDSQYEWAPGVREMIAGIE